jgi:hypothetical protein
MVPSFQSIRRRETPLAIRPRPHPLGPADIGRAADKGEQGEDKGEKARTRESKARKIARAA